MEAAAARLMNDVADHVVAVAHGIYTEHIDTSEQITGLRKLPGTDSLTVHVVSEAPYSVYTEFGHMTRGGGTWVAPVPAMRMALASAREAFPAMASKIKLVVPGESNAAQHMGVSVEK